MRPIAGYSHRFKQFFICLEAKGSSEDLVNRGLSLGRNKCLISHFKQLGRSHNNIRLILHKFPRIQQDIPYAIRKDSLT